MRKPGAEGGGPGGCCMAHGHRNWGWGESRILPSLELSIRPRRSFLRFPLSWVEATPARCPCRRASLHSSQLLFSFQTPSRSSSQSFSPAKDSPCPHRAEFSRRLEGPPRHRWPSSSPWLTDRFPPSGLWFSRTVWHCQVLFSFLD